MYGDMRFSRTKPLKEYMYIRFREPFGERDILGLYFDMGCDYYGCGIRIYKQTGAGMERIREYAVENSQPFSRELENLKRMDIAVIGDKFARDHYPEINNAALNDFLNRKNFYIERACPVNKAVFNGKLPDEIAGVYSSLKGLYSLLRSANELSSIPRATAPQRFPASFL
jgi:hypothetical protein